MREQDREVALSFIERVDRVLGLLKEEDLIPTEIKELALKRIKAREDKDWEEADRLRDEIKSKGYEIKDSKETKEGFIVTKI